jgi:hypothetical protein
MLSAFFKHKDNTFFEHEFNNCYSLIRTRLLLSLKLTVSLRKWNQMILIFTPKDLDII